MFQQSILKQSMSLRMRVAVALVALAVLGTCASAQPAPGDPVFGKLDTSGPGAGLFWIDGGGKLGTILLTGGGRFPNAIMPADDNRSFVVCLSGTPARIVQVTVGGAITTLLGTLPQGSPNAIVRDQDGTWVISTSGSNALLRFDPVATALTTIYAHGPETNGIVNGVTVDPDTQDYLIAVHAAAPSTLGGVYRVSRNGSLIATLASGAAWQGISSVSWDHYRGRPAVTKFTAPQFVRVEAGGNLSTVATVPYANAQRFDGEANVWVGGDGLVRRIHGATGATITTHAIPGFQPTSLILYGDRPLRVSGSAATNSTLNFHLHSVAPADPGLNYYVAFSEFYQPGVKLPDGRVIQVGFDDYLTSNLRGFFDQWWSGSGNRSVLDAQGKAAAGFTIPSFVPLTSQFRFYAVFITIDPKAPNGVSTISNTVPFATNL